MDVKVCSECKNTFPLSDYYGNGASPMRWYCKPCHRERNRKDRRNNPDRYRGYEYKKKYKITLEQYNTKAESQNGRCAICGEVPDKPLVIDHNHNCCPGEYTCGKCNRGLLCGSCNKGLGFFKDSASLLASAMGYLLSEPGEPW